MLQHDTPKNPRGGMNIPCVVACITKRPKDRENGHECWFFLRHADV
jgi:hypothetical protein